MIRIKLDLETLFPNTYGYLIECIKCYKHYFKVEVEEKRLTSEEMLDYNQSVFRKRTLLEKSKKELSESDYNMYKLLSWIYQTIEDINNTKEIKHVLGNTEISLGYIRGLRTIENFILEDLLDKDVMKNDN